MGNFTFLETRWSDLIRLSEAQTRELIDEQLRKVGWDADTAEIRYSKGIRPVKGKNLAIAEHKNTVLLAMATGTGKTRTVLGMIYRFLSVKRFKRVMSSSAGSCRRERVSMNWNRKTWSA